MKRFHKHYILPDEHQKGVITDQIFNPSCTPETNSWSFHDNYVTTNAQGMDW